MLRRLFAVTVGVLLLGGVLSPPANAGRPEFPQSSLLDVHTGVLAPEDVSVLVELVDRRDLRMSAVPGPDRYGSN